MSLQRVLLNTMLRLTIKNKDMSKIPLAQQREMFEEMSAKSPPPPDDVRIEKGEVGGVPGEWLSIADEETGRVVVYFHGGGYVLCSPKTHRDITYRLAREAKARVFVPDYRLAPEHPFPAAVEDATQVCRTLIEGGQAAKNLAVAGDSAGGGLTLATLLSLKSQGIDMPGAAVLISPWLDLAATGETITTNAKADPFAKAEGLAALANVYLNGADRTNPLASPYYGDLTGLPPLLVHVGSTEILLSDSTRVVDKARAAGVDAALEIWPKVPHAWHMFAARLPEARDALEKVGQFIRARLPGS